MAAVAASSSKASSSPPPPPHHSPLYSTPIHENDREENEDENEEHHRTRGAPISCTDSNPPSKHHPTPLRSSNNDQPSTRKRPESDEPDADDRTVSCNKCRPSAREKISVVPLDINGLNKHPLSSIASPNGIFKSIISSLTRKSPKCSDPSTAREEQWKVAIAEISHKLIQATRKRDEAVLEASRLKYTMVELEKKLNKLEIYCHNLKSGLDECSSNSPYQFPKNLNNTKGIGIGIGNQDKVVEHFVVSVSEARSSVRILSRSITVQLRKMGGKIYERISSLLQPYEVKISFSKNPRSLLFYLEALLNKTLYEDFESIGFQKNGAVRILNPIERCEANFGSFTLLQGLTWEEVLNKGTRHFSEDFSRFCDRKMSEIVAMLGWNRAWPEPLLQAFFGAAKSVWLVHLLARSVHPGLVIFRVDKGVRFDGVYMEDMGGDKGRKLVPTMVRIMVAPGFYVYSNVVKCKVLCRYNCNNQGLSSSP